MRTLTNSKTFALAILMGASIMSAGAQTKPPDNSAANKGDQVTAQSQKTNKADQDMTAQIRKSVIADKSLSTYAHNVKIITQDGMVTLKGPVRSDDEVKSIVAKATEVAGSGDKVINQLEVKPPKSKN
jgi:osmotically-inducible protein OsmY